MGSSKNKPDPGKAGPNPAGGPTKPCPVKPCITQIKAKIAGTKGVRDNTKHWPDKDLTPSSKNDESLTGNKPVILVRGCTDVELEAVTTPPNTAVTWNVKPNENTSAAPTLSSHGPVKATLKTDKPGSFSVIGTLGACKVVWNVVFVWVKVNVKSSKIKGTKKFFKDGGSTAGSTSFVSGDDNTTKHLWQAEVKLEVIGGGKDGKLGVGKVEIHTLQNGTLDTLTGNYQGGGTGTEVPKGGLPVLDSTNGTSPYGTFPDKVTPANSAITDASKDRTFSTADSPAGGFPHNHQNTGKPIQSISGVNAFKTAVASTSTDAPGAIVVHAQTTWTADFSGSVNHAGKYTPTTAHVKFDKNFALISEATGGQDAAAAPSLYDTFEPRWNAGTNTTWKP